MTAHAIDRCGGAFSSSRTIRRAGVNASLEMERDYTIIVLSNYSPPTASHVATNARRAPGLAGDA